MSNTITLADQDKAIIRTAAYGAVSLLATVSAKPHRVATAGSLALNSATGLVGHVLSAKSKDIVLNGKTTAALADQVLPALTEAMAMLNAQSSAEADNFRQTVQVALEAGWVPVQPAPAMAAMMHKINAALGAA
ncbi:hypothetical protein ACWZHB_04030 [Nocardia sp. FBN12]|uniref:hypothetical protein n=1 Tax=Nocardia sp. FBN12 TaxID=3419766 RepID=UPI003D060CC1